MKEKWSCPNLQLSVQSKSWRVPGTNCCPCTRDEPGTLQFQVLAPREDDTKLVAIEIYRDDDAFEAHRNSASIARFRQEAAGMYGTIVVTKCTPAD